MDINEAARALQQARDLPATRRAADAAEARDWGRLFAVLAILVGVFGYALILLLV